MLKICWSNPSVPVMPIKVEKQKMFDKDGEVEYRVVTHSAYDCMEDYTVRYFDVHRSA